MAIVTEYTKALQGLLSSTQSKVQSVAGIGEGGVLIRVSNASDGLVSRLRQSLPLATVALTEDLIGSSSPQAQILFPSYSDQVQCAKQIASSRRAVKIAGAFSKAMFVAALLVFLVQFNKQIREEQ